MHCEKFDTDPIFHQLVILEILKVEMRMKTYTIFKLTKVISSKWAKLNPSIALIDPIYVRNNPLKSRAEEYNCFVNTPTFDYIKWLLRKCFSLFSSIGIVLGISIGPWVLFSPVNLKTTGSSLWSSL